MTEPITVCKCTDEGYWENGRLISRWIFNTSQPFLGQPSAAEIDKHETAAWYGRGEKPEHAEVSFELDLSDEVSPDMARDAYALGIDLHEFKANNPMEWETFRAKYPRPAKPAKPGLFVVQGEGRYQGLGFSDLEK